MKEIRVWGQKPPHRYTYVPVIGELLGHVALVSGLIGVDDIHYSPEMERAWEELKRDARVTTSMDLYHIGLLFVDPHYLKRHYKIRI